MAGTDESGTRNEISGEVSHGMVFQAGVINIEGLPGGRLTQGGVTDSGAQLMGEREAIQLQRQLIETALELSKARQQLLESFAAEQRTSQMVMVLQVVLFKLSATIGQLTNDRDYYSRQAARYREELEQTVQRLVSAYREEERATGQLERARTERQRAGVLAEANQNRVLALEQQLRNGGASVRSSGPVGEPHLALNAPTSDDILGDTEAGLDRVQRLLDEQDEQLDRLESSTVVGSEELTVLRDAVYRSLVAAWRSVDREAPETVTIKSGGYEIQVTEPDIDGRVRTTVTTSSGQSKSFDLDFSKNPEALKALTRMNPAAVLQADDDGKATIDVDGVTVVAEINLVVDDGASGRPEEYGIEFGPE